MKYCQLRPILAYFALFLNIFVLFWQIEQKWLMLDLRIISNTNRKGHLPLQMSPKRILYDEWFSRYGFLIEFLDNLAHFIPKRPGTKPFLPKLS